MKLDVILVPLDGSLLAEAALPRAIDLAKTAGARVLLLRATEVHTILRGDTTEAQTAVVQESERYLDMVKGVLQRQGVDDVETSVWYGHAAESIVEAAATRGASLIVMSTHGRTGLGRLVLGSVAESVLRCTLTPILLMRDAAAPVQAPATNARRQAA